MIEINGTSPSVHERAWVAPGAVLTGAVTIGDESSVWYTCVLRADMEPITIGARSNVQDGTVVHTDPGFPVTIGDGVTIGHRAVVHGCTIADDVLIGMGAVVMNGVSIGAGSLVAAGAVLTQGLQVPPGSMVAGVPGKVRRELSSDERSMIDMSAAAYIHYAGLHAEAPR